MSLTVCSAIAFSAFSIEVLLHTTFKTRTVGVSLIKINRATHISSVQCNQESTLCAQYSNSDGCAYFEIDNIMDTWYRNIYNIHTCLSCMKKTFNVHGLMYDCTETIFLHKKIGKLKKKTVSKIVRSKKMNFSKLIAINNAICLLDMETFH